MRIIVDANILISIVTKLDGVSARVWLEADPGFVFTAPDHVEFCSIARIPDKYVVHAVELTKDIDTKDSPYVALALYFDCQIWTGDRKLSKGLSKKDLNMVLDTTTMRYLIDQHNT